MIKSSRKQRGLNRMEQQKRPMKLGVRAIVIPICIYFLVSIIIEAILGVFYLQGIMVSYLSQSQEFMMLLESLGETATYSELSDMVNGFMTDEVVVEITNLISLHLEEFGTYTTIISGIVAIPLFSWIMIRDKKKVALISEIEGVDSTVISHAIQKVSAWKYVFIAIGSGGLCIALNNFIKLMNLAMYSQAYQEAAESLYSVPFIVQVVGLGVFVPIAEELLFRGVLYQRLKIMANNKAMAMLWSALLFAAFHGNLVQALYGFIAGVVFVWLYEEYGSIKAPIVAHICMNIVSIVLTQYDVFYWMFEEPLRVGIITVVSATTASICYVFIKELVIFQKENMGLDNRNESI